MTGTAWITGASSGLGRSLALLMAADGWQVAASARRVALLRQLSEAAEDLPGAIHPYALDVSDRRAVQRTVMAIRQGLGAIDQAVLNAGDHRPVWARAFDSEDFDHLLRLNMMGPVYALEALLPAMIARRSGRVALVASLAGYRGLPSAAAYGMTKAGLINLAEALRPELSAKGVVLQLVNPGFIKTPLTDRNDFAMPFLMDCDRAANRLLKGLASDRFEIVFPWRMALAMKIYRLLPYPVAMALARRWVPGVVTATETLQRYVAFFEGIERGGLAVLRQLCSRDILFVDPINEIEGVEEVIRLFEAMFDDLEAPRFSVSHWSLTNRSGFIRWTFEGRLKRGGRTLRIEGVSEIELDDRNRVAFHRDHWDPSMSLYAMVPLLGPCLGFLRRRLALR